MGDTQVKNGGKDENEGKDGTFSEGGIELEVKAFSGDNEVVVGSKLFHLFWGDNATWFDDGMTSGDFDDDRGHGFDGILNFFITFFCIVNKVWGDTGF